MSGLGLAARLGGDEFAVVLPGAKGHQALALAEAARAAIAAGSPPGWKITCSAGVAIFPDDARTAADLIQLADGSLYWAKTSGRDQCPSLRPRARDGGDRGAAGRVRPPARAPARGALGLPADRVAGHGRGRRLRGAVAVRRPAQPPAVVVVRPGPPVRPRGAARGRGGARGAQRSLASRRHLPVGQPEPVGDRFRCGRGGAAGGPDRHRGRGDRAGTRARARGPAGPAGAAAGPRGPHRRGRRGRRLRRPAAGHAHARGHHQAGPGAGSGHPRRPGQVGAGPLAPALRLGHRRAAVRGGDRMRPTSCGRSWTSASS